MRELAPTIDPGELLLLAGFGFYPSDIVGYRSWILPNDQGTHAVAAAARYDGRWRMYYYDGTPDIIGSVHGETLQELMQQFPAAKIARTACNPNSPLTRWPRLIPQEDTEDATPTRLVD